MNGREEVSLDFLVPDPLQQLHLFGGFRALGDHFHFEHAGDVDEGRGYRRVSDIGLHRAHERLIDLHSENWTWRR